MRGYLMVGLMSFLLASCGQPAKETLTLSYDTNAVKDDLITVANAINYAAGCDVIVVSNTWAPRVVSVAFEPWVIDPSEPDALPSLGVYSTPSDTIVYRWADQLLYLGPTQPKRTLIHEIGHALGLVHSDDPDSVMFAMSSNRLLNIQGAANSLLDHWAVINPGVDICDAPKVMPPPDTFPAN